MRYGIGLRRRHAALVAYLLIGICSAGFLAPARAQQDVVLENHIYKDGQDSITFRRIEFTGTNLSRDEVLKLFSATGSTQERLAIATKLQASRIALPSVVLSAGDARITIADLVATGVEAGKVKQLAVGGLDSSTPSKPDGLLRFKTGALQLDGADVGGLLQALADNDLKKAVAQFQRFSARDIEAQAPDDGTPAGAPGGNLNTVKIAVLSADAAFDSGLPLRFVVKADHVTVDVPPSSPSAAKLKDIGIDRIDASFGFTGTYDPTTKVYELEDVTMSGANLGTLTLKGQFTHIEPGVFSAQQGDRIFALLGAGIAGFDLRFTNDGIAEKILGEAARQQNVSLAAFKADLTKAVAVIPMLLGGNPNAGPIAEALARFVDDPKRLSISAKAKAGSVSLIELFAIREPGSLFAIADVQVAANDTAAGNAPVSAPPAASDQPLTGAAAWQKLIGNSISGKDEDGNALTEYYLADGTVKQLVDDETATGKWVIKSGKVCFTFPDDDEDEEACYNVTVDGTIATFADDKGSGRRYQIVPGNPKRL